jgi:hypothetical protein
MSTIKLGFALAGGSFGTLLGAALQKQSGLALYVLAVAGVIGALIAVVQLRILAQLHQEFVASVRLLHQLRGLVP